MIYLLIQQEISYLFHEHILDPNQSSIIMIIIKCMAWSTLLLEGHSDTWQTRGFPVHRSSIHKINSIQFTVNLVVIDHSYLKKLRNIIHVAVAEA